MSKPERSNVVYQVWSTHEDGQQVMETRRTDQSVAYSDMSIIKSILFRSAWVVEA
jgi:hypothetical protein